MHKEKLVTACDAFVRALHVPSIVARRRRKFNADRPPHVTSYLFLKDLEAVVFTFQLIFLNICNYHLPNG